MIKHLLEALTSKIKVQEIRRAHLSTLTKTVRGTDGLKRQVPSWGDKVTFFVLPLAGGLGLFLFDVQAPSADPLLAAIAVLTGLLFALLVLMFERVTNERATEAPAVGNDPVRDAWQLLVNVSWAILVSLALLVLLFATTLFTSGPLAPWLTGAIVALFAHLGLTLLMILKRVFFMASRIAGPRRLPTPSR